MSIRSLSKIDCLSLCLMAGSIYTDREISPGLILSSYDYISLFKLRGRLTL